MDKMWSGKANSQCSQIQSISYEFFLWQSGKFLTIFFKRLTNLFKKKLHTLPVPGGIFWGTTSILRVPKMLFFNYNFLL